MDDRRASGFYNDLAGTYDEMTRFQERLAGARRFVAALLTPQPVRRALDVATGSGLYAIALAEKGVSSVGLDIAPGMLEAARRNAAACQVSPAWLCAPMDHLPVATTTPGYDLLLCMGNSLPHVLGEDELHAVLREFRRVLRADGRLVLQVLNYGTILKQQERIVSADRQGDREFIRFYDFLPAGNLMRFNVLTLDWSGHTATHQLASVLLRGWLAEELTQAATQAGFGSVELHGGLDFRPWQADHADTLLLTARA